MNREKIHAILARAKDFSVGGLIAVATDFEDSSEVLRLAQADPSIQASLGMHPHEASRWEEAGARVLETLAKDPNVRFLGETGLDGHYTYSPMADQEKVFRLQIQMARRLKKPLMIHTREAAELTIQILKEEQAREVQGIIHCFSEDLPFASQVLDLGFYISFSGILTFKGATAIQEVAKWAPLDRILVETDSPYLAPVPHRGKTNEPAFVKHTAEYLAKLRGMSLEKIAECTTNNLETLCGWHPPC